MYQYHCLNPIAEVGLKRFDGSYAKTDNINDADAILVRSAAMHDVDLPDRVCVIGRAGAGVNNIPLGKYSDPICVDARRESCGLSSVDGRNVPC